MQVRRRMQAPLRMHPSHQGFHAAQCAGHGIDAWLIHHDELVFRDCAAQRLFLAQAVQQLVGQSRLIEREAALALRLGRVQRQVGVFEQRVAVDAVAWKYRDADRSLDHVLALPGNLERFLHGLDDQPGNPGDVVAGMDFLQYDGAGDVPSQIHSYLSTNHKDLRGLEKSDPRLIAKSKDRWYVPDPNKAQDLEKKREKALLKEFQAYLGFTGRRLKEFRLEVLRAGFKDAWSKRDYQTIISVAKKIPDEALQEDEKLLLWYDQALTRTEADA